LHVCRTTPAGTEAAIRLVDEYHISNANLELRKRFLRLTADDISVLKKLSRWADRVADSIAKEFYDHQFAFPGTRQFFEQYARTKGISLDQLRQRLERMQAQYFREIFRGGDYGQDYYEQRLRIGAVHEVIDFPLKWYVGSYALYADLVRTHLRRSFFLRPGLRSRAERAILTVFNYDMQAVTESYLHRLLRSSGVDLQAVRMSSDVEDTSDRYGEVKNRLREAVAASIRTARVVMELSNRLSSMAEQSKLAVDQIASAIDQVAKSAVHQMEQVSAAAQAVDRMAQGIEMVAEGAREQGDSVRHALDALAGVRRELEESARRVRRMGEHSQRIAEMAEAISGIADQTNLLALNAAIEAARAGEHGRGFAVVAEEVRKLAEGSARSAKEVAELVAGIREAVDEAVGAMERLTRRVEGELVRAVEQVSAVADRHAELTRQMAASAADVRRAMENMASVTQQNSAAAQQVSASAEEVAAQIGEVSGSALELRRAAGELQQAVAAFRVEDGGAGRAQEHGEDRLRSLAASRR
jgi:methyl-accepting chemotaxis protein